MQRSELKKARAQAQNLGLSANPRFIGGQHILEIKSPHGTLLRFWSSEQWAEYHTPALEQKRKRVPGV